MGRIDVAGYPAMVSRVGDVIVSNELDVSINNHQLLQLVSGSESVDTLQAIAEGVLAQES